MCFVISASVDSNGGEVAVWAGLSEQVNHAGRLTYETAACYNSSDDTDHFTAGSSVDESATHLPMLVTSRSTSPNTIYPSDLQTLNLSRIRMRMRTNIAQTTALTLKDDLKPTHLEPRKTYLTVLRIQSLSTSVLRRIVVVPNTFLRCSLQILRWTGIWMLNTPLRIGKSRREFPSNARAFLQAGESFFYLFSSRGIDNHSSYLVAQSTFPTGGSSSEALKSAIRHTESVSANPS